MNIYYNKPYTKELATTITGAFEEEGTTCVQVETNIFHPHGGGQKGDRGSLTVDGQELAVCDTKKDKYSEGDGVLLILKEPYAAVDQLSGKPTLSKLDWDFRFRQMRLHSAVHLHHCMMEKVQGQHLPHPKTSDIQDRFAFNRYEEMTITPELAEKAATEFRKVVEAGAPITRYADESKAGFWWWECLGYKIPCGGTHVGDLKEIGPIEISFSTKKGNPTINFRIT